MTESVEQKILYAGSDSDVIGEITREIHKHLNIKFVETQEKGLEAIKCDGPFAVIVSDLGQESVVFLRRIQGTSPESVCVMLTDYAEIDTAVSAMNEGRIFKFLAKPCEREVLLKTLNECLVQYRRVVSMSSYTYVSYVENGAVVRTDRNKGCFTVTGYNNEDFLADHSLWSSMILPEHRLTVKKEVDRVIAGDQIDPVEFKIRSRDGSVRWIRDTIITHVDDDGQVFRFDGYVEDITEQKEMAWALQQSQERYERIVANVPGLVYQFVLRTDGGMEFQFVSGNCKKLFGVDPEEAEADSSVLLDMVHPDDRAEFYSLIAESSEKLCPWQWQGRGIVDGRERWFQAKAQPERQDNGDTIWDGVLLDVTEHKKIEEQAYYLAKLPGEDPDPVMRISSDGIIIYANKASSSLLKFWDRQVGQLIPEDLYETVLKVIEKRSNECVEVKCKDLVYSIIFSSVGDSDYVNLYGRDISKAKQAEMELMKKNQILREQDRLKSEFVSTVSHELRTPLCIFKNIISNAMAGVMGKLSHRLFESMKMADRSIDRLSRIISDFLDISKIDAGKMKLHREVLSINLIVNEVVDLFSPLASTKGIVLKSRLPREEIVVEVDHDRIMQVLTNLVGNAIKFIPTKGHIEIDVSETEEEVKISVRDDGPGLTSEQMEKIFDRFVQVHLMAGPGEHGTGLGLPIANELVKMHDGRMWVESTIGEGSSFCFVLPKWDPEKAGEIEKMHYAGNLDT